MGQCELQSSEFSNTTHESGGYSVDPLKAKDVCNATLYYLYLFSQTSVQFIF